MWSDLDLDQAVLTVRRTFSPDGAGRMEIRATKSGKVRYVPILDELLPHLDAARGAVTFTSSPERAAGHSTPATSPALSAGTPSASRSPPSQTAPGFASTTSDTHSSVGYLGSGLPPRTSNE
jgi:hypothetical protein